MNAFRLDSYFTFDPVVDLGRSGLGDDHASLQLRLFDSAQQNSDVVARLSFCHCLVECLDVANGRLERFVITLRINIQFIFLNFKFYYHFLNLEYASISLSEFYRATTKKTAIV